MHPRFYRKFSLLKSTVALLGQKRNQPQTIKINRNTSVTAQSLELESRLGTGRPCHNNIALLSQGIALLPEHFADTLGRTPDIYPSTYLKQPYRQAAT